MPSRSNPASQVVTYFETVPLETAAVVLAIVKGIVKRRAGPTAPTKPPKPKKPPRPVPPQPAPGISPAWHVGPVDGEAS